MLPPCSLHHVHVTLNMMSCRCLTEMKRDVQMLSVGRLSCSVRLRAGRQVVRINSEKPLH